jgi:rsbT antagonist protein RsbS
MSAHLPVLRIGRSLVVTIQAELDDNLAEAFQGDILLAIEKQRTIGLVIDISALEMVDSFVARTLVETAQMARIMGSRTVLVGMQAEVAATLVRMGFEMKGVETALDVEEGLSMLQARRAGP